MRITDRLTLLPWLSLALLLPLAAISVLHLWFDWGFSGVRLVRSLALLQGETLFPASSEGWIHISLYGPVAAAAFVPAVLVPSSSGAILAGQLLALAYYLVPAWLLIRLGRPALGAAGWAALVFFAVASFDLWSLRYVALTIHSDSPTLALGALACASLLRWRDRPRGLAAAALFAVLALWSKQVALGVPFALAGYVAYVYGWRAFLSFAGWGMLWSVLVSFFMLALFGPLENLLYHLVTVPGLHTWRWGGGWQAFVHSAELMLRENPSLPAMATLALLLHLATKTPGTSWRQWILERPWLLLWWVALVQLPFALAGRVKVGGDVNAYSHSLYFLLLGLVLALRQAAEHSPFDATPWIRRGSRGLLYAAPLLTMLVVVTTQENEAIAQLRRGYDVTQHPYAIAARYASKHPGTVYFPRMNLVTGLGEKRLDHQVAGLIDLDGADKSPTRAHFHSRLPPKLDRVVFHADHMVEQAAALVPYLHLERLPDEPDLPGFWVYSARLNGEQGLDGL